MKTPLAIRPSNSYYYVYTSYIPFTSTVRIFGDLLEATGCHQNQEAEYGVFFGLLCRVGETSKSYFPVIMFTHDTGRIH